MSCCVECRHRIEDLERKIKDLEEQKLGIVKTPREPQQLIRLARQKLSKPDESVTA